MSEQTIYGYDCKTYKKAPVILKNIDIFQTFLESPDAKEMKIDFKYDKSNIGIWKIKIYDLPDCKLRTSLQTLRQNIGKDIPIKLIVEFPFEFPFKPPFIWIKSPKIIYSEGGISGIFNGVICTDVLMQSNWSPIYTIDKILIIILNLLNYGAKVENETTLIKNTREKALGSGGLEHIKKAHPDW